MTHVYNGWWTKRRVFSHIFKIISVELKSKVVGGYIERVYFEIKETNIEQWNKPHIKESKKAFLHLVVNETDDKEKLEQFINFCEDTIFEVRRLTNRIFSNETVALFFLQMQHAVALSGEEEEQANPAATAETTETVPGHPTTAEPVKLALSYSWSGVKGLFSFTSSIDPFETVINNFDKWLSKIWSKVFSVYSLVFFVFWWSLWIYTFR